MRKLFLVLFSFLFAITLSAGCRRKNIEEKLYLPYKTVRIGILSKYHLNRFDLEVKKGILFTQTDTVSLESEKISVKKTAGGILELSFNSSGKKINMDSFSLLSQEEFKILFMKNGKRVYTGNLDVRILNSSLIIVNEVDLETYVYHSARAESGELLDDLKTPSARQEYLDSMETVIRSFLVSNKGRHEKEGYDLCDLTHCQVYSGGGKVKDRENKKKYILVNNKRNPVSAYFSSTCGGTLAGPEVYWPSALNNGLYRVGTDTASTEENIFCRMSPHYRWTASLSLKKLGFIFSIKIKDVRIVKTDNRVSSVIFLDEKNGKFQIPVSVFLSKVGRSEGWSTIKSNDFDISMGHGTVQFSGKGLGHGIGLCQWGARTQAMEGRKNREILNFYFPGAILEEVNYEKNRGK